LIALELRIKIKTVEFHRASIQAFKVLVADSYIKASKRLEDH
jgi:hypothetical protein